MSRFLQTTLLLLAIVFITAGCIGKTTPQSDDNKSGGSEQTTVNANSTQVPVGDLAKWQTLTRESEGFSMKLPQGWWWQRDSDLQAELDAGFAVGFAWNQGERDAQNYAVIFFIANENELAGFDGYQKVATTQNDKQYVFRGAFQYRDIINAMAESFELLGTETNDLGLQSEVSTKNWKTYRDEELNIEFQYPASYYIKTSNESLFDTGKKKSIVVIDENKRIFLLSAMSKDYGVGVGEGCCYHYSGDTINTKLSLNEISDTIKKLNPIDIKRVTVDGIDGVRFFGIDSYIEAWGSDKILLPFQHGVYNNIMFYSHVLEYTDHEYDNAEDAAEQEKQLGENLKNKNFLNNSQIATSYNLFNQILSTFKFIE